MEIYNVMRSTEGDKKPLEYEKISVGKIINRFKGNDIGKRIKTNINGHNVKYVMT